MSKDESVIVHPETEASGRLLEFSEATKTEFLYKGVVVEVRRNVDLCQALSCNLVFVDRRAVSVFAFEGRPVVWVACKGRDGRVGRVREPMWQVSLASFNGGQSEP